MAQSGSAPALGAGSRGFESLRPDHRRQPAAGALFRALRHADVEAESAYAAVEEVRGMAGHNVVVEISARIDTLRKALWPLIIALSATLLSAVGGGLFVLLKRKFQGFISP